MVPNSFLSKKWSGKVQLRLDFRAPDPSFQWFDKPVLCPWTVQMTRRLPNDERGSRHEGRFIAFWAIGRAGNAKGRKMALPALPYSRLVALERCPELVEGSLLSVALSSAIQFSFYHPAFLRRKWPCFQN